jgi:hypothetical protein
MLHFNDIDGLEVLSGVFPQCPSLAYPCRYRRTSMTEGVPVNGNGS